MRHHNVGTNSTSVWQVTVLQYCCSLSLLVVQTDHQMSMKRTQKLCASGWHTYKTMQKSNQGSHSHIHTRFKKHYPHFVQTSTNLSGRHRQALTCLEDTNKHYPVLVQTSTNLSRRHRQALWKTQTDINCKEARQTLQLYKTQTDINCKEARQTI